MIGNWNVSRVGAGLGIKIAVGISAVLLGCTAVTGAIALDEPSVQYANISPLPGGGVALSPQGSPDGQGAMQINIPVAYTPRWGFMNAAVFKGNHAGTVDVDNGSGVFGMGFGEKYRVYISGMQVSHIWSESKALNAQALLWQKGDLAISCGYQDIMRKELDQRAPYLVATQPLNMKGKTFYGTLGYGGGRFLKHPFAGVSVPLGDKFNAVVEYDGWQGNTGLAWRPGGRNGKLTLLAANNGHLGFLFGGNVVTWFGR